MSKLAPMKWLLCWWWNFGSCNKYR